MATRSGPLLGPENATHVSQMPPLVVTTTGIPGKEHVDHPAEAERISHLNRWVALAMAAVLALALGAIAVVMTGPVPDTNARMGLSDTAWAAYRAGERASAMTGVGSADWQSYRTGERS